MPEGTRSAGGGHIAQWAFSRQGGGDMQQQEHNCGAIFAEITCGVRGVLGRSGGPIFGAEATCAGAFVRARVGRRQHVGRSLIPALPLRMVFVACVLVKWGSGWCLASRKATATRRARRGARRTGRTNVRRAVQDRRRRGAEERRGARARFFDG